METNNGINESISLLNTTYGVRGTKNPHWSSAPVPIYSAELHPSNRSKIVSRQLEGIKKALDVENKALRLREIVIEVINPYKHRWYSIRLKLRDEATKTYIHEIQSVDTTPITENTSYIVLIIVY